jgi:acetylornithine deacetylase/succinyl-diaminopimelate desuccinylase-like protein
MNPDLTARTVLVLNLEHIAQFAVNPETWEVERTEQSMGWGVTNLAPALLELTDRAVERYGFKLRPRYSTSVAGDLGGYAPLGVPRVQAIHAGPLYHTTGDVFESISVHGLERAARFYAYYVDGVAKMPRPEIDRSGLPPQ